MFNVDHRVARADFVQDGCVHLRGVLKQMVVNFLVSESAETFCCGIAALTGIKYGELMISERQFNLCDWDAES